MLLKASEYLYLSGDKIYLRYSINAFNSQQDLDKLFAAITDIKSTTGLIG